MLKDNDYIDLVKDKYIKVFFKYEEALKDFVNSYFAYIGISKTFSFTDVSIQAWIAPDKKEMKDFFGDIIICLNTGEILLIEIYSSFGKREYNKSENYAARAYSNQMKVGDEAYEECKNIICLNLMSGNYERKNNELVNRYIPMNRTTKEILDNANIEMVLIRLDLTKNIMYNKDTKRFIRWLKIIYSKSFREMEEIAKGDRVMEQSIEYIKRYCNSNLNHGFQEILDEKVYEAKEEALKQGEKQNKVNIAKKMLVDNFDIDVIAKYTELSKNQILKLKK